MDLEWHLIALAKLRFDICNVFHKVADRALCFGTLHSPHSSVFCEIGCQDVYTIPHAAFPRIIFRFVAVLMAT